HDMGVVADMADRIIVMRSGKVVESGTADEIFYNPQHPYTKQLLEAVPHLATEIEGQAFGTDLHHVEEANHELEETFADESGGDDLGAGSVADDDAEANAVSTGEASHPHIERDSTETYYHPGSQADFSQPSALQLRDAAIEYPAVGRKKAFRAAHH
ncbi:ABC transporter ATP-binding protein, partial [Burkholderia multivorans]